MIPCTEHHARSSASTVSVVVGCFQHCRAVILVVEASSHCCGHDCGVDVADFLPMPYRWIVFAQNPLCTKQFAWGSSQSWLAGGVGVLVQHFSHVIIGVCLITSMFSIASQPYGHRWRIAATA